MNDVEALVRRTVSTVTLIADKAARFSGRILALVTVVCVAGFLLGLAALSGGIETVWIVLGVVFGSIAIGGAFKARWRVGAVRRHTDELADEIRALATDDPSSARTVIETFAVDEDGGAEPYGTDPGTPPRPPQGSAIVLSRRVYGYRDGVGPALERSPRLSEAVTAITTFPFLLLAAVLISVVFAFLGLIFLIALAL